MRKTAYITVGVGLVGSILLFLLRQTEWFARQMRLNMSEFGEMADSAFWASLITLGFGLVLLPICLRWARTGADEKTRKPTPLTVHWICPHCGGSNTQLDRVCRTCGENRPLTLPAWTCPWCGTENEGADRYCRECGKPRPVPAHDWTCSWCGTDNPGLNKTCSVCGRPRAVQTPDWVCAWCGTENPESAGTCSVCGNPRAEPVWTCKSCGTDNPLRQRTCLVCGEARTVRLPPRRICPRCGGELQSWDTVCPRCGSLYETE